MTLYSHSRLSTYENCPLKYKYQYIEKPEIVRGESIEAYLGSRCHEALEYLYRLLLNRRMLALDELLEYFRRQWEKNWSDSIYIVRSDLRAEDYQNQGIYALEKYYRRYHPFGADKTIAVERRIEIALDDAGQYRLQGFIDRISEAGDGHYRIHDYKTERMLKSQAEFDQERQLALYQIGLMEMFRDIKTVKLIWHYLLFDKEVHSSRDRQQLERLKIDTIHLIQRIEEAGRTGEFPYHESALCDWCDFYSICPAKKHLDMTEKLSPREFMEDEGVRLVNRLWEIKQELSALEIEKESLEDDLYQFCRQFGADIIRGSECKIRLKVEPKYRPRHALSGNPEEKERFMQFLKERGLYDKVMMLNSNSLNSLIKGKELSDEIRQNLIDFVVIEEGRPRIYFSRLREED